MPQALSSVTLIDQPWSPWVVAQMYDYPFKVVRIEGEFIGTRLPKATWPLWYLTVRCESTCEMARRMWLRGVVCGATGHLEQRP